MIKLLSRARTCARPSTSPGPLLTGAVPRIELEYVCKKCANAYPVSLDCSGKVGDIELGGNQSRCPFCGEWNCADARAVEQAVKEG